MNVPSGINRIRLTKPSQSGGLWLCRVDGWIDKRRVAVTGEGKTPEEAQEAAFKAFK